MSWNKVEYELYDQDGEIAIIGLIGVLIMILITLASLFVSHPQQNKKNENKISYECSKCLGLE